MPVTDAFAKAHPAIAKYLFSGSANRLMLEESELITSVLLRLMDLGVTALPVHDSIIAPARYRDKVRQVMLDSYSSRTGFGIVVE